MQKSNRATSSNHIELHGVAVAFAGRNGVTHALEAIDLAVGEGDFACIVGPSGCGKTTLLRLIAGLVFQTSGEVRVDGERVTGPKRHRGVVFQAPALYPWLDVAGNVACCSRPVAGGRGLFMFLRVVARTTRAVLLRFGKRSYFWAVRRCAAGTQGAPRRGAPTDAQRSVGRLVHELVRIRNPRFWISIQ